MRKIVFLLIVLLFPLNQVFSDDKANAKVVSEKTHPLVKLRHGLGYIFTDTFNSGRYKSEYWNFQVSFTEQGNYNNSENPSFAYTPEFKAKKWIIPANQSFEGLAATKPYYITHIPLKRVSNAISIKYTNTFREFRNNSWAPWTKRVDIQNYEITWCGDGVIDRYKDPTGKMINEECDPATKDNLAKRCSKSCKLVK